MFRSFTHRKHRAPRGSVACIDVQLHPKRCTPCVDFATGSSTTREPIHLTVAK
jgi:hypothetical protein